MKIQLKHGYNWDVIPERQRMTSRAIAPLFALVCLLLLPLAASAQLPTPTYGINIGNTLEAPCGDGCWNPVLQQSVVNQYAASGFNAVRIPVHWDSHANQSTLVIDPAWMARVKQVVDWCLAKNMAVIINQHHNGWINTRLDGNVDADVTAKMDSYWRQIAQAFSSYDSKLLFSAVNEEPFDTAAKMAEMKSYYQTFIDAVRGAGGNNNVNRWLILPGPNTDIDLTDSLMTSLPNDPTPGRLMVEVHYYSPYQFCLMSEDANWGQMFYFWGHEVPGYHTEVSNLLIRNATWGEEDYMLAQFQKMQARFTSKGIPVVLGEHMAYDRTGYAGLTGTELSRQKASVTYFYKKLSDYCNQTGLKPFVWDTGFLIDRNTGAVKNQYPIPSLTGGAAVPPPDSGGGCTASQTHVDALVTVVTGGGNNKRGKATITVTDNCGNPVANATVTGNFSGTFNETGRTAVTGANGVATITTNGKSGGSPSVTFCVSNITKSGLTYTASANVVTCDSN